MGEQEMGIEVKRVEKIEEGPTTHRKYRKHRKGIIYTLMGEHVRELREVLGWTQADFASKSSFSVVNVGLLELGKLAITLDEIREVSATFGMTPEHFLAGISSPADATISSEDSH